VYLAKDTASFKEQIMSTVIGQGTGQGEIGVYGESQAAEGVRGVGHKGAGVSGTSEQWIGVYGESQAAEGVRGVGHKGAGVSGTSEQWIGVYGESQATEGVRGVGHQGSGVSGTSEQWIGVYGESQAAEGVRGVGHQGSGVSGTSEQWTGVYGESAGFDGVLGVTTADGHAGVAGVCDTGNGNGVYGRSAAGVGVLGHSSSDTYAAVGGINNGTAGVGVYGKGARLAGFFDGDVEVTGDIRLTNADCAEDFDVAGADTVEPGTVMVLGNEGALSASQQAYDKRVAGVISGAGDYKPGIVLDKRETPNNRQPIALMGKVFCKVDAQFGAIEVGDLLTTSPTAGHAMKTSDPLKAFGAVIGKALRPLANGQGLIPILIALQ
jgi:hypothetical protein